MTTTHILTEAADQQELAKCLEQHGYYVFTIDGAQIVDTSMLFASMRSRIPLNPPIEGNHNWDALSDSLFQAIVDTGRRRVAILWLQHDVLQRHSPRSHELAIEVLEAIARTLANPNFTVDTPVELKIVLASVRPSLT